MDFLLFGTLGRRLGSQEWTKNCNEPRDWQTTEGKYVNFLLQTILSPPQNEPRGLYVHRVVRC